MGRGFFAGSLWGALVGVLTLALASQLTERRELTPAPPRQAELEIPPGTEFNRPPPETDPIVPAPDTAPAATEPAPVAMPEETEPPAADTVPLTRPETVVDAPSSSEGPDAPADAGASAAGADAPPVGGTLPELPVGEASGPAPVVETAPRIAMPPPTDVAQPPAPAGATGGVIPPVASDHSSAPAAPSVSLPGVAAPPPSVNSDGLAPPSQPSVTAEAAAPAASGDARPGEAASPAPPLPQADALPSEASDAPSAPPSDRAIAAAPAAPVAPDAGTTRAPTPGFSRADGVRVNRLPTIGGDAPAPENEPAEEIPVEAEAEEPETALLRHAVPFENPDGQPLVTVILIHDDPGAAGADTGLDLPVPVSFAIDAGIAGAREIASAYRAAGRETLLIPTLPPGAAPSDVEVALGVNLDTVPEAVALMDAPEGGFQSERDAVAQVVAAVSATGHGLVTFPRGLNTAQQLADRAGVPARLVFRLLEEGNTDAALRTLDQAAFRARQEGVVILVGQAEPATVAALLGWVEVNPDRQIAFAPVSAALTAE